MKQILTSTLAAACMCLLTTPATADDTAKRAYQQLSGLVGSWKRQDTKESKLIIQFELTAGSTVLMESWMYGNKTHSLTVYHRDGKDLIATHYCPQGNQPRLAMVSPSKKGEIRFDFKDATNLESLDQSHQHGLSFMVPTGEAPLIRGEIYSSKTGLDVSELRLIRIQP